MWQKFNTEQTPSAEEGLEMGSKDPEKPSKWTLSNDLRFSQSTTEYMMVVIS